MAKARTIVLGGKKKPDFENGPTTPEVEDTVNRVDFMLKLWTKGSAYTVEPEDVDAEWKMELLLELESIDPEGMLYFKPSSDLGAGDLFIMHKQYTGLGADDAMILVSSDADPEGYVHNQYQQYY